MNVIIRTSNENVDYTNLIDGEIVYDERLDQVLDSMQFTMIVPLDKNIAPFTKASVRFDDGRVEFFMASSVAQKVMTTDNQYIHNVTFVEATKILECYILGSKSFSYIEGKNNYNSNYDRINIISKIIEQKYGVLVDVSHLQGKLNEEREYSFGPGTTMFDAILEICQTENCIPRITNMDFESDYYTLDIIKISDLQTTEITPIRVINDVIFDQNVDEYCSKIETEMSEVVDRNTFQTITLSCRSQSTTIYVDNACLITPSKIDNVKKIVMNLSLDECQASPILLLPKAIIDGVKDYVNESGITELDSFDCPGVSFLLTPYEQSSYNDFYMALLNRLYSKEFVTLHTYLSDIGLNDTYLLSGLQSNKNVWLMCMEIDESVVDTPASSVSISDYYMCIITDKFRSKSTNSILKAKPSIDISNFILDKDQWDLLSAREQPHYIYFKHGENYIDGFNNYYNSNFWEKIIYKEVEPFIPFILGGGLKRIYKVDRTQEYYTLMLGIVFDTMQLIDNNIHVSSQNVLLDDMTELTDSYVPIFDHLSKSLRDEVGNDFTRFTYTVTYSAMTPVYLMSNKSVKPANQVDYTMSSRSYNNGSTSIDFNQLVPAIERHINMLGLEQVQVTSLNDISVGKRTAYGYIHSKQSLFKVRNNNQYIIKIVYNMSPNYEQLAAAIAVKTQYEATNIPNTGIIDRYIYIERNYNIDNYNDKTIYLIVKFEGGLILAKPCIKLKHEEQTTIVSEMVDNYTFDYQKSEGSGSYYKNNPITFSDDSNYRETVSIGLGILNNEALEVLNQLPQVDDTNIQYIGSTSSIALFKDSRERLIFVLKMV